MQPPARQSRPDTANNTSTTQQQQPQHPDGPELERLSIAFVDVVNTRDWEFQSARSQELLTHISPDYTSEISSNPMSDPAAACNFISLQEHVVRWRERALEHPDVLFEVMNITSDINAAKMVGTVFADMRVSGIGDVVLHAMNAFTWKMNAQGRWMCCHTVALRGSLVNAGMP